MKCPKCQKEINFDNRNDKYCSQCGHLINGVSDNYIRKLKTFHYDAETKDLIVNGIRMERVLGFEFGLNPNTGECQLEVTIDELYKSDAFL